MSRLGVVVSMLLSVLISANAPNFEDYSTTEVFRGQPAEPRLSTREARAFRTELRRQAGGGPNFAGHFTIALWGCGAGCVSISTIDARTGEVWFAPFTFEDGWKDGRISCHHSSDFRLASELLIIQGRVKGRSGTHYFRWHNRRFTLLRYDKACSP